MAEAKSLDLKDAAPIMGYGKSITGTCDYQEICGSRAVVVTAGFPRQPGMSREDLISKNARIVKDISKNIKKVLTDAIIIMVTNPLDIMTYIAYNQMGCDRRKVFGMAGGLDTSRFKVHISEALGVPAGKVDACVLGSHGDTMVPLVSKTTVDGEPLEKMLDAGKIRGIVSLTKKRGGRIVSLLKSGSAYFSPSAASFEIIESIATDSKKIIPCSCIMDGEYGIKDCAIGVPARIGKGGIEEIVEWKLPDEEISALRDSAMSVKRVLDKI